MEILLKRNPDRARPDINWHLEADLAGALVAPAGPVRIPVHEDWHAEKTYNAEVCGWRVEAEGPSGLIAPLGRVLRGLANAARLPTYVFVARRTRRMYPVYTLGDEVLATTPGGPVFRHVELARVRDHLNDYLHAVGELGAPGKSETLHVRGVSATSLALVRPLFYLKKRATAAEENEFWAPVFPSADGLSIYVYAASGRREVELSGGHEVLQLRSQVAQALRADGRLDDDVELRADRLQPELWIQVRHTLRPTPFLLTTRAREFAVFAHARGFAAAEPRRGEDRFTLHLGTDPEDLRRRMADELVRRGVIVHESGLILRTE
jgi:hypothetical protein